MRTQNAGQQFRANTQDHIIASTTVEQEKAVIDQIAAVDVELGQLQQRH